MIPYRCRSEKRSAGSTILTCADAVAGRTVTIPGRRRILPRFNRLGDFAFHAVKKSMLSLVFTFGDANAERVLRDFLLRTDQPDDLQRAVSACCGIWMPRNRLGAYSERRWIRRAREYAGVELQDARPLMKGQARCFSSSCWATAARNAQTRPRASRPLHREPDRNSRVSPASQEVSFAAALEYLGRKNCGEEVTEEEIGEIYRVSNSRLRNAILKLAPFAKPPKEEV